MLPITTVSTNFFLINRIKLGRHNNFPEILFCCLKFIVEEKVEWNYFVALMNVFRNNLGPG